MVIFSSSVAMHNIATIGKTNRIINVTINQIFVVILNFGANIPHLIEKYKYRILKRVKTQKISH